MMARPRSKKHADLERNLYATSDGGFVYQRPSDGKRVRMGSNKTRANNAARKLNAQLQPKEYQLEAQLLYRGLGMSEKPTLSSTIQRFKDEYLIERDLSDRTLTEYHRMLGIIESDLGTYPVEEISVAMIANFLDRWPANSSNKYRARLLTIFRFALSKGLYSGANPVDATLPKIERVQRERLKLTEWKKIRAEAERLTQSGDDDLRWFVNALDLALHTLQRREDLTDMCFEDVQEQRGSQHLLVKQRKVNRYQTGRIAIKLASPAIAIIDRCRDEIVSPYLLHRISKRRRIDETAKKLHPTKIAPEMLSRKFKDLRDLVGVAADLPPEKKPSFHEIRALGATLYERAGVDPEALLGHASERSKMTQVYLERHELKWALAEAGLSEF